MSKVITFSRTFPAYHPKAGQPTHFVEKLWASIGMPEYAETTIPLIETRLYFLAMSRFKGQEKHHTIRAGLRWKVGDKFSPRVWSGKPYNSKQIVIAPDIEVKKVWNIKLEGSGGALYTLLPTSKHSEYQMLSTGDVAANDGLDYQDFKDWFNPKGKSIEIEAQIICWNKSINY